MDPVLLRGTLRNADPCSGHFPVDIGTGGGGYAQENVVVGNTGAVFPLEFEAPQIPEGRPEEAVDTLQPAVEILLDSFSVDRALGVVGQAELRLYDVPTIAAQVVQTAAGLAGKLSDGCAGSRDPGRWWWFRMAADEADVFTVDPQI